MSVSLKHKILAGKGAAAVAVLLWLVSIPFVEYATLGWRWAIPVYVVLFLALNVLAWVMLFLRHSRFYHLMMVLAAIFVIIFYPWHWLQIFSILFIVGAFILARIVVDRAFKRHRDFNYYYHTKKGITVFLIALLVIAALNTAIATLQILRDEPERFYQSTANVVTASVEPIIALTTEGYDPVMSLREFLERSNGLLIDTDIQAPPDLMETVEILGVEVSTEEQVSLVLSHVVEDRVRASLEPIEQYIPWLYALLILLAFRFVLPVVVWLTLIPGQGMFKLAEKLKLVEYKTESVEVKMPTLGDV